jgi:hypothetical protein
MRAPLPSNIGVQALSLALATSGGVLVGLLLAGGIGGRDASVGVAGSAARTAPVATPLAEAARPTLGAVLMSSAPAAPTSGLNLHVVVAATPAPTPSADDAWRALQPQLDAAWQTGPDQSITLLEAFLLGAPDYPAGREKLYAALLAHGHDLFGQGDVSAAASQLERAQQLFPERAEASELLSAMTPEPTAEPVPADAELAAQGDVPADAEPAAPADPPVDAAPPPTARATVAFAPVAPARVQPAAPPRVQSAAAQPVRQPQPAPPLPTPTKVPFVPP